MSFLRLNFTCYQEFQLQILRKMLANIKPSNYKLHKLVFFFIFGVGLPELLLFSWIMLQMNHNSCFDGNSNWDEIVISFM